MLVLSDPPFKKGILHTYCITFYWRENIIGQKFLTNHIMMNENEVSLRVDVIFNICWKGQLSQ